MGCVFEARDEWLGILVALKVIAPELSNDTAFLRQTHHELLMMRRISHPNVCRVFDIAAAGELQFITMELIAGKTLAALLEGGPVDPARAVAILDAVCAGLEAAHAQGIVHRDLKPCNVMLDENDRIVLTDFGLAQDLHAHVTGGIVGTPHYWAPEQGRGERATRASDIYSLGVIAYELATGRPLQLCELSSFDAVAPPFREVVERCLQMVPHQRFAEVGQVRRALAEASKKLGIGSGEAVTSTYRRSQRRLAAAIAIALPGSFATLELVERNEAHQIGEHAAAATAPVNALGAPDRPSPPAAHVGAETAREATQASAHEPLPTPVVAALPKSRVRRTRESSGSLHRSASNEDDLLYKK
jgi:serine/threonine protein kinase